MAALLSRTEGAGQDVKVCVRSTAVRIAVSVRPRCRQHLPQNNEAQRENAYAQKAGSHLEQSELLHFQQDYRIPHAGEWQKQETEGESRYSR